MNKMKKLLIYLFFATVTYSYSQEFNLPVFTQYLADNPFVVSPAYAGIGDNLRIRANGLTQWVGIKGAPDNQSLYADIRIANRSGVGVSLYNDSNGNTKQTGAKFSFAHHLVLDTRTEQFLSFGISYNLNSFRIDIDKFNTTIEYPIVDPYVINDRRSTNHNFDISALYRIKGLFVSFNANNILDKNIDETLRRLEPNLISNYQVYAGYTIPGPKNTGIEYEPSVFYQLFASDKRSATDINFKFRKHSRNFDYYWAGISYRFLNDQFFKPLNVGPMAGFKKSQFYFGYSYQLTINDIARYNSGTHMITIGIDFFNNISNCPCTQTQIKF